MCGKYIRNDHDHMLSIHTIYYNMTANYGSEITELLDNNDIESLKYLLMEETDDQIRAIKNNLP